jgi:DNA-binding GntR family transcriptional regulator
MNASHIGQQRLSTKDLVYYDVKKKIINGHFKPGEVINEERLAYELEISRTPIREALQRLVIEELVVRQNNGRLKVAPITIEEAQEIFQVRSLLEGLVTREATINATENDITKLQQLTQILVEAAENDQREFVVTYGSNIHSYLYTLSGNRTAIKILNQLNDHISRYRRLAPIEDDERSKIAAMEHQEIFEVISKKDYINAENLMKQHINKSLSAAITSIKNHLKNN